MEHLKTNTIEIEIPTTNVINLKGFFIDKQLENKTTFEKIKIMVKHKGFKNIFNIIDKMYINGDLFDL